MSVCETLLKDKQVPNAMRAVGVLNICVTSSATVCGLTVHVSS